MSDMQIIICLFIVLNPHIVLPVRNGIIGRGVKRYQWDIISYYS